MNNPGVQTWRSAKQQLQQILLDLRLVRRANHHWLLLGSWDGHRKISGVRSLSRYKVPSRPIKYACHSFSPRVLTKRFSVSWFLSSWTVALCFVVILVKQLDSHDHSKDMSNVKNHQHQHRQEFYLRASEIFPGETKTE